MEFHFKMPGWFSIEFRNRVSYVTIIGIGFTEHRQVPYSFVAFRGLWCSAWEARPCTSAEEFRHLRDRDGCLASCCTWRRVVCLIPLTVTHVSRFPESMENQPWHNLNIRLFMPIISTSLTKHVLKKYRQMINVHTDGNACDCTWGVQTP